MSSDDAIRTGSSRVESVVGGFPQISISPRGVVPNPENYVILAYSTC